MNTSFSYIYRDAGNWKQLETVILRGKISHEAKALIYSRLESGLYFLPQQVGLPALQSRFETPNDLDHIWHELEISDILLSEDKPTVKISAAQLVGNFRRLDFWKEDRAYQQLFGDNYPGQNYGT